jgi:nucleosome-remodeling factor subunit
MYYVFPPSPLFFILFILSVVFAGNENGPISPMHDIPLYANKEKSVFNMVVEVPRWTNAKMEVRLAKLL